MGYLVKKFLDAYSLLRIDNAKRFNQAQQAQESTGNRNGSSGQDLISTDTSHSLSSDDDDDKSMDLHEMVEALRIQNAIENHTAENLHNFIYTLGNESSFGFDNVSDSLSNDDEDDKSVDLHEMVEALRIQNAIDNHAAESLHNFINTLGNETTQSVSTPTSSSSLFIDDRDEQQQQHNQNNYSNKTNKEVKEEEEDLK